MQLSYRELPHFMGHKLRNSQYIYLKDWEVSGNKPCTQLPALCRIA